ncbi:MAG: hypothetical protein R3E03_00450 [Novosphingobium sp.]
MLAIALGLAASGTDSVAVDGDETFGPLTARAFALRCAAEFTVRGLTPIPALIPAPILAPVAARCVAAGFAVFPGEGIEHRPARRAVTRRPSAIRSLRIY